LLEDNILGEKRSLENSLVYNWVYKLGDSLGYKEYKEYKEYILEDILLEGILEHKEYILEYNLSLCFQY
jgi:hypothetical protein